MYPKVLAEGDDVITFESCTMCEQDAMVEHDGHGLCRECYTTLTETKEVVSV